MALYQYCIHPECQWTAQWGGGTAADDPATEHAHAHPEHTVRSGAGEPHVRNYYAQRHGGNVVWDAPGSDDWPLPYVSPGEVHSDLSEAEVAALAGELNDLREKVDAWSCDECGERQSVCTRGVDGPALCRECAGFTTDHADDADATEQERGQA